jgi:hypothetical protein
VGIEPATLAIVREVGTFFLRPDTSPSVPVRPGLQTFPSRPWPSDSAGLRGPYEHPIVGTESGRVTARSALSRAAMGRLRRLDPDLRASFAHDMWRSFADP